MYVIYDDAGTPTATIVGPDENYGPNVLDKNNQKWIFLKGMSSLDPRLVYVDVTTKQLMKCSPIQLAVDKPTFNADGHDVAKVTGIPLQALVSVFFNNQMQAQETMVDDALELTAAAPGEYRIEVTCSHHLPANIVVEAQ